MDRAAFDRFTALLTERLAGDARVLGVVALGSMAAVDYEPDEWSDHDVWVVTVPEAAEAFRQERWWLPEAERIVLAFGETAHGIKVLYDDGHLVEAAVFAPDELAVARAGRSRVLLDRAGVAPAVAAISGSARPDPGTVDVRYELGMFLTNLLVGVGRARRGEVLSGHRFVASHALDHLLRVLLLVPSPTASLLDGLDGRRRVERAHPVIGAALGAALSRPVAAMARELLALAQRELWHLAPPDVRAAALVVARRLDGD